MKHWDEETYTQALREAGFTTIEWKYDLKIAEEGMARFGEEFWNEWKKTTAAVGILCIKQ
ncbi:MAG: hypothetical protein HYV32_05075 [Candidatus Kerfeldbacteria bacterium]|nr:hypothetical protein [Candidatus Kerfeldbacteria bacterium]